MLCAGVVHGDLSDFNVLVGAEGPVLIDFPQSVDTAHNANARKLLLRDVENLHRFLKQFAPNARRLPYAEEMWELFQQNAITPDTRLTGRYRPSERRANTHAVLELIGDANYDERKRRESLGLRGGPPAASSRNGPPAASSRNGPPAASSRNGPPAASSRNGPPAAASASYRGARPAPTTRTAGTQSGPGGDSRRPPHPARHGGGPSRGPAPPPKNAPRS
jgi:RIO kinase 1